MTIREIEIPQLTYGYVPKYFETMRVNLPSNKTLVITPSRFEAANYYQGKGIVLNHNAGSQNWDAEIPNFNERARFIPATELQNFGTPPVNWTDAQYIEFANSMRNSNPVKIMTSSWNEGDYNNPYTIFGQNTGFPTGNQYKWYKALGNAYRAIGGEYFMDYSGLGRLNNVIHTDLTTPENARTLLNSNVNCLQRARELNGYAPTYLTTDLHNFLSWCFNGYFADGGKNQEPDRRMVEIFSSIMMNKNAMTQLGNTTAKSMGFFFSSNVETNLGGAGQGYTEKYTRPMNVGGQVECFDMPCYSFTMQLALTLYSLMECDVTKWWGNSKTFTTNPDIIGPDELRAIDNFPLFKYYGTGNPQRSNNTSLGLRGGDNGYFSKPYGQDDAMTVAARAYGLATLWTGNTNFNHVSTRKTGVPITGTGQVSTPYAFSQEDQASLAVAKLDESVHCKASTSPNGNNISLIGYSFAPTKETFEVKVGAVIIPITVYPSTPFVICVDVNDTGTAPVVVTTTIATTTTQNNVFNERTFSYAPITESTRPADGKVIFEGVNGQYILRLDIGGTIAEVRTKVNGILGPDLVDKYDTGREIGYGMRSGTQTIGSQGYQVSPSWDTQTYNPNEGGDWTNNGSPVAMYGFDSVTQTAYVKTSMLNFPFGDGPQGQQGYRTGVTQEQWVRLVNINGIEVLRTIRKQYTFRVADAFPEQVEYKAYPQEWPFVHIKRGFNNMYFVKNVNGAIETIDISLNNVPTQRLAERWFAGGSSDNVLGIVGEEILFAEGRPLDQGVGAVNYMVNLVINNLDSYGVRYGSFDVIATNNVNTVRQHYNNIKATYNSGIPHFDFRTNKRFRVGVQNSTLVREADMDNRLVINHTSKQPYIKFPRGLFNAIDLPILYIRMRLRGVNAGTAPTTIYLSWDKPGQNEQDKTGQRVPFTISQTYQTIAVNLSGHSMWNGVINELTIEQDGPEFTNVTETFWDIEWIDNTVLS